LKKNIIFITIDGARLDRVKNSKIFNRDKSVFLSQCITYGPHTIASMHAIFSGCYGTRTGTNSYWSTYKFKKNQFLTLTQYLKNEGYFTRADIHSEIAIPRQGFDEFIVYDENENLIERHTKLLENVKTENKRDNFFLYLHYDKIHSSIVDSVLKKYTNFSKEYFENKKRNDSKYDELFHNSELYLEIILNKIHELKLFDNSIIVVISDHGISTGEKFGERAYGAFCYDYTLKTFCYFYDPELEPKEISQQIRTVDFMPTILELLEIPFSENFEEFDGESLCPLFNNLNMEEKFAYSETGNPLSEKTPPKEPNTKSIRTSNWKLIYNEYDNSRELYNLQNDPDENKNLIDTNLEIENIMWSELQKYIQN